MAPREPVDALIVATGAALVRVEGDTLREVWRAPLTAASDLSFGVSGDVVLVQDARGLRTLDLMTGTERAAVSAPAQGRRVVPTAVPGVALVRQDGFFARLDGGTLVDEGGPRAAPGACASPRLRAFCDGAEASASIPGFDPRYVLGGGSLGVAVADAALVGFDAGSKRVIWQRALPLVAVLREGNELYALSKTPPRLARLDPKTGLDLWSVEETGSELVARRDRVYVAACDRVAVRERTTGRLLAEVR